MKCVYRGFVKRYIDTNDDGDDDDDGRSVWFRNALLDRNACLRYDELLNPAELAI